MPVYLKIPYYTFTFSEYPLLTQHKNSYDKYVCLSKIWCELDYMISPILLVIILVLQCESRYLKNCKRYRSEILHKSTQHAVTCQNVYKQQYIIKGTYFCNYYYNRIPVIDKLCPSPNPITTMFTIKLHVC